MPRKHKTDPRSFTPAQASAARQAQQSAGTKTPDRVLNAYFPTDVKVGDITFQPVTLSVIMALQKAAANVLKAENAHDFGARDIAGAVFILTQPIDQVRKLINAGKFDEAVDAMSDEIPAGLLGPLSEALNHHLTKAFETAIPYGEKKELGKSADSPFPEGRPPAPGSAG